MLTLGVNYLKYFQATLQKAVLEHVTVSVEYYFPIITVFKI